MTRYRKLGERRARRHKTKGIAKMSDAEFAEWLEADRECSKCRRILKGKDFEITSGRGAVYPRNWCKRCVREYYADFYRRRKVMQSQVN